MDRTQIGINGLDEALNGGIPKGNIVLIAGGAGTGKSTLAMQFLVNGAEKFKEKGLYITTEQKKEDLEKQAAQYGWNLPALQKAGKLAIFYLDTLVEKNHIPVLEEVIEKVSPQRIVIDSMTTLTDNLAITDFKDTTGFSMVQIMDNVVPTPLSEKLITKNVLYNLINMLKTKYQATVFLTSELYEDAKGLSADGVSEFICDGVIKLDYLGVGSAEYRSLLIRKMRYTKHQKDYVPYDIENNGISVKKEEIFK